MSEFIVVVQCQGLLQERLALNHGTQCGFCTPGMVMSMYALLRSHPLPSVAQMERAVEGMYAESQLQKHTPVIYLKQYIIHVYI